MSDSIVTAEWPLNEHVDLAGPEDDAMTMTPNPEGMS
jgi:hypothetical protein